MKLSSHITTIIGSGSDGWDLFYKARKLVAEGVHVTELTIGEHDIRTDPVILDALDAATRAGHTGYSPIAGAPALRETIAKRIADQTGVPTTPDNIVVVAGGQFGLFTTHMAVLDRGDAGMFIDPYYATYTGTVRAAGGVPVTAQAFAADGFQPRADVLDAAIREHAPKSLLINTPNNPTGVIYTPETLDGIARIVTDHDMWLISDEVYDTQIWHGTHLSPRALPGMTERTMVVGSLSKSHAMTGSRLGWICAPEEAAGYIQDLCTHASYGIPGFIQQAGLFALNLGPAFEAKIAEPFRRRRAIALDLLAKQDAIKVTPSAGAMYLFLDIRATGLSGEAFAESLLDEERIAVMPGESFGPAASGHIRVALTVADDIFSQAVAGLIAFAEKRVRSNS